MSDVITINGSPVTTTIGVTGAQGPPGPAVTPGTAGQGYFTNAGATAPVWATYSGAVTASATTIGQITLNLGAGATVTGALPLANIAQGGALTGNTLGWSGAAWAPSALNLAGGANYVTGVLPTANQASQAMGGEISGTTAAAVVAGPFSTASWVWNAGIAPTFSQTIGAAVSTGHNFTISPQAGGATSGQPGSFVVNLAPPNGGSAEAAFTIQRNSVQQGSIGSLAGVAAPGFWLGTAAQSATNFVCESDGSSFTYYNTPSVLGFLYSGSTFIMYVTGSNVMHLGGTTNAAPVTIDWSTATTPLVQAGTSATTLTVGTNKTGATTVLTQDASITAWTLSGGNALSMTAPATSTSVTIGVSAAAAAGGTMTINAQGSGGTNDGGALSLGGGQHSGASKADGSVKVTTPFNPGFLSIVATSPTNLNNVQSDANVLMLTGGVGGAFTVNVIREIADTSLMFIRNNTGQTATIAYLTGGTVTLATNTGALICSDGSNLQKIFTTT